MLVDDELDVLHIVRVALEQNGFSVKSFANPLLALRHFEDNGKEIELVITDSRMQEMSGFELTRRIKKLHPKVKVILITAFEINKKEFETLMPHTPIDGFLHKPFQISKLIEAINALD